MLQQEKPEDFVISTGRMSTVRKLAEIQPKLNWNKSSSSPELFGKEKELKKSERADTNEIVVRIDPYFRPSEVIYCQYPSQN